MPPRPMVNRAVNGPYDELSTPREALQPLLEPLRNAIKGYGRIIWECAPGEGKLVKLLMEGGFMPLAFPEMDFLDSEIDFDFDAIVTNPPFSKKVEFVRRCVEIDKPFALLLPITSFGVRKLQPYLKRCGVLVLPRRIDFTGKGAPWFPVAWFCGKILPAGTFHFVEG